MTLSDKRIEWEARMKEWKESGRNVAQWCREHDVNVHQMYYWKQRLQKENADTKETANWLPVQVTEGSPVINSSPIFIHVHDYAVEVPVGAESRSSS
ncbi:IS66 family insertion sequence element accessory protein TnpA [Gracilibacillus timonensis]|uniref:IS66 family insertion sequence element accessory protein TnpA n=1 Tax=Gracilibacillus timonensis TaxID=1816696 RepID=UPI0008240DBC|nr:transposase [Gracilibacillus timonensis]